MNEGVLFDFFKFTSTDKIDINSKDLDNFEIFISKTEFEDIHESLIEFLNDLVFWSSQKLELNVIIPDEGRINLNVRLF